MKDKIKRSAPRVTDNAYASLGKASRINFAPAAQTSDSDDADSSRFNSVSVNGADNRAFVDMKNLRKQIP